MNSDEFITEILGQGWDDLVLPHLLEHVQKSLKDAQRYAFVRDYAKTMSFNTDLRDRVEMANFDAMLDKKILEYLV
jgi:hypothetical protein